MARSSIIKLKHGKNKEVLLCASDVQQVLLILFCAIRYEIDILWVKVTSYRCFV